VSWLTPMAIDNGQHSTRKQFLAIRVFSPPPARRGRFAVNLARLLALATIVALALVFVPVGGAGTVTLVDTAGRGALDYSAADGEANVVRIEPGVADSNAGTQEWLLTETGGSLVVGPGCASVDADTASCTDAHADDCTLVVTIVLGDGNDEAEGSTGQPCDLGAMFIEGGEGNDVLTGAAFENFARLRGGPGDDRLAGDGLVGGPGSDVLKGVRWENILYGGAGADTIQGEGLHDFILGGPGNDEIEAFVGPGDADDDDWVRGGAGKDRIAGGPGPDHLFGGRGADSLSGGRAADVIAGGRGRDYLAGGRGGDTFRARDGRRDRVLGGLGNDQARVDIGLDVVRGIESFF
jgi:Ca2+-binding RTX toxin-like protein